MKIKMAISTEDFVQKMQHHIMTCPRAKWMPQDEPMMMGYECMVCGQVIRFSVVSLKEEQMRLQVTWELMKTADGRNKLGLALSSNGNRSPDNILGDLI